MTYEEAMQTAKDGLKVMLPHFHWCWVEYDSGRGIHILENEDGRRWVYRSTASERKATDWMAFRGRFQPVAASTTP